MQINGSPITSVLIPAQATGSSSAESAARIPATAATARDKHSEDTNREQQQSSLQQTNSHTNNQVLNPHRISKIGQIHNKAVSTSTHMAQRTVRTFQQIDQLGQAELMNRVDTLA